jgi:xylulokinase
MEGVAFALRQVLDTMAALHVEVDELTAAGNGLQSPLWRQIVSDVLGKPLILSQESEQTGRGAAMIAGIGAGLYSGYEEIVSMLPSSTESTEPIQSNTRVYEEQYRRFCELYPLLKPMLHELSSDQGRGSGLS